MSLRFGIPTLDLLIDTPYHAPETIRTESIALLGSDGTGKSLLALHLASRYAADCSPLADTRTKSGSSKPPRILYVSSDLKEDSANKAWTLFSLNDPDGRHIPFEGSHEMMARHMLASSKSGKRLELRLKALYPDNPNAIVEFLTGKDSAGEGAIGFLDLASHTAGDDWSFVNTLLVKLASIPTARDMPHLVIIDSVEGFETFVGRLDAYGNEQTRRSRVAQCIRNAGSRVQLVFVVEEPQSSEHLAEEYVTDVVLRLRKRTLSGNRILTVEVQKARGREHAKGEHPLEIRPKGGTSTGDWENADTPRSRNAYVQVFHSVAHRNRIISASRAAPELIAYPKNARFGLPYLDELLPDNESLKPGTVTALIGDSATGKSTLGEKFIAEGFRDVVTDFVYLYLLRQEWKAFHNVPEVRAAFSRTHWRLSSTILPGSRSDGEPSTKEVEEIASWYLTEKGWFPSLVKAVELGEKATEADLSSRSVETRHWDPPEVTKALKRWALREAASSLAQVGKGVRAPKARFPWTMNWNSLIESVNLAGLFQHPNLTTPGVLLSTADRRGTDVAKRCLAHLEPAIQETLHTACGKNQQTAAGYVRTISARAIGLRGEVLKILDPQIIVRRFELEPLPAAAVMEVIQRNLAEANKLIFGLAYPSRQNARYYKAGRIRLVIDDLRVLANINPEIAKDGSFLPFLSFVLEHSGVVSLLVHTDILRPNAAPQDEITRALLSVLKCAILTWNAPFEGRSRIAIGAITPHRDPEKNGLVRELTLSDNIPNVTRNFEIYSGVEDGRPVPVPLAVYIFKETEAFSDYVEEEDKLFRELFSSVESSSAVNPGRVIFPVDAPRYLALRDYTHLSLDAQDSHTMVFQVDEFWALTEPHILTDLEQYLGGEKIEEGGMGDSPIRDDPFRVFAEGPLSEPRTRVRGRLKYFTNLGYDFVSDAKHHGTFRTPFMWDFGFVLVRSAPWKMAGKDCIFATFRKDELIASKIGDKTRSVIAATIPFLNHTTVNRVLSDLSPVSDGEVPKGRSSRTRSSSKQQVTRAAGRTSWRKFLGACKQIADVHHQQTGAATLPFDIASPSPETMNSLILEMWRSEIDVEAQIMKCESEANQIFQEGKDSALIKMLTTFPSGKTLNGDTLKACFERFKAGHEVAGEVKTKWRDTDPWSVRRKNFAALPLGALCLYKVWLLLLEVLPFEDFIDSTDPFTFRTRRDASMHSVASRHWYKTACSFSQQLYRSDGIHDSLVAMRMPGKYSTRGDWYLGSPRSSRSKLLAQYAMDLLCSRRANLTRLQHGLGLPVRDIASRAACSELRTALRCKIVRPTDGVSVSSQEMELSTEIKYGELIELGKANDPEFEWLLRSGIQDYDRLGRPLQKWLVRLFHWTCDYKVRHSRQWRGGFAAYDALTCKRFNEVADFESFVAFGELCDFLLNELKGAQRTNRDQASI